MTNPAPQRHRRASLGVAKREIKVEKALSDTVKRPKAAKRGQSAR